MPNDNLQNYALFNELSRSALADNTRIAYKKAWNCFENYCSNIGQNAHAASPQVVANFLIYIATTPSPRTGRILSMNTVSLYLWNKL